MTFTGSGTQVVDQGGSPFFNAVHSGTGTIMVTDNFDFLYGFATSGAFTNSAGTFNPNGSNVDISGLTTVSGGNFLGSTGQCVFAGGLTISGGTFTGSTGSIVVSNVSITSGTLIAPAGVFNFNVSGNWSQTGGTFTPGTGTVAFTAASGTQTLDSDDIAFNNLAHTGAGTLEVVNNVLNINGTFINSAGTFTGNGINVVVNGLTTVSGGTVQSTSGSESFGGGLTIAGGTVSGSGGFSVTNLTLSSGTLAVPAGGIVVFGNWSYTGGTFTPGTNTVSFDSATSQTLDSGGKSFGNLAHIGEGTLTLINNPLTVADDLTNSNGIFSLNGENLTVSGTGTNFSNNNGTVQLVGSETVTGLAQDTSFGTWLYVGNNTGGTFTIRDFGTNDYYNLAIDAANPADTFQLGNNLSVLGTFTLQNGIFNADARTVAIELLATVSGGTYETSTTTQTLTGGLSVAGGTFTASSGAVNATNVTISSGTLTAPNGPFNVSGNWSKTGGTFTPGSNTVGFDGASGTQQTLDSGGSSFFNVTHSTASTVQLVNNPLTLLGSLTISLGTFNANGQSTTVGNSFTLSKGTYLASTATQNFPKSMVISGGTFEGSTGSVNAGAVTISGGTLASPSGSFTVAANWSLTSGTFTSGTNTVTFTMSSGTQTLDSGGQDFGSIIHSGAGTLMLINNSLVANDNFTNSAGIFYLNGWNWSVGVSTGGHFSNNNGTIELQGSEIINVGQDNTAGTWEYVGNGVTNSYNIDDFGTVGYFNLKIDSIDNTDTFSPGTVNVAGTLLVANGKFADSYGATVTVTGATTVSGGYYVEGMPTKSSLTAA